RRDDAAREWCPARVRLGRSRARRRSTAVVAGRRDGARPRRATHVRARRRAGRVMFTGIVEVLGTVTELDADGDGGIRLGSTAPEIGASSAVGASVAVNGCCLTVVIGDESTVRAHAVPETMARTTLGGLRVGDRVNLERPLRADDRLGGHVVQG